MSFNLADAYEPAVWKKTLDEKTKAAWSLANSVAVRTVEDFSSTCNGPSRSVELPFFRDIEDQDDEIQVERTAPSMQGLGTGKQVVKVLNRVIANDASAESRDLGHDDPLGVFLGRRANRYLANRQKKMRSILTGVFGTALSANSIDHFEEATNTTAGNFWNVDYFHDATSRLGVLEQSLSGGVVFVHPDIYAAMKKADEITFVKPSEGMPFLPTFKGMALFMDAGLSRTGTTSGTVYSSYLIGAGAFGHGIAEQPFYDLGARFNPSLSHFALHGDPKTNVLEIFDRTREIIHIDGTSYTGSVAGETATNAELATANKWTLAYADAKKVPIVRIRTNG